MKTAPRGIHKLDNWITELAALPSYKYSESMFLAFVPAARFLAIIECRELNITRGRINQISPGPTSHEILVTDSTNMTCCQRVWGKKRGANSWNPYPLRDKAASSKAFSAEHEDAGIYDMESDSQKLRRIHYCKPIEQHVSMANAEQLRLIIHMNELRLGI